MLLDEIQNRLTATYTGKKILITGASGFVAGHLIPELKSYGAIVSGIGTRKLSANFNYQECDLRDRASTIAALEQLKPDFIFHLASQSSVGASWTSEWETIESNVKATYNLLHAAENTNQKVRIVVASSGEVYGDEQGRKSDLLSTLKPQSPYAVSKAMMEMIFHRFQNNGIEFVIARSFNHTGPGRPDRFFEGSVAKQFLSAIQENKKTVPLKVGNLDIVRDYSDVRQVVQKYLYLNTNHKSGTVVNVCSGQPTSLRKIISIFETITGIQAEISMDPSRVRKSDIPYVVGTDSLPEITNAFPYTLEKTLKDLLESYKSFTASN